ncbi:hypothetical protein M9458_004400, partial [Cirrhinus mrigala]
MHMLQLTIDQLPPHTAPMIPLHLFHSALARLPESVPACPPESAPALLDMALLPEFFAPMLSP